jgi:hypothetical protein
MLCCVDVTGAGVSHSVEMITQHKYGRHITAVAVSLRMALAILFPQQLQGDVLVRLELAVDFGQVESLPRGLAAAAGPRREQKGL